MTVVVSFTKEFIGWRAIAYDLMNANLEVQFNSFKEFSLAHRERVYDKIKDHMAPLERLNSGQFYEMVNSYSIRKGQYRRPSYILAWDMLYGGDVDAALLPAAAMQLSEDYLLMHDDFMDSNEFRRGLPSAHKLYGVEYAINAGDTLHTILWKVAGDAKDSMSKPIGRRYFDKFYDIMLTTHVGQYFDLRLTRETKDITKFTMEDYYNSIHAKSAYYSVYGPMQCGAIIAGAKKREVEGIKNYGSPAGLAFQIKDDILDCMSTEAELGKSIGTDVSEGVKTIILWHCVQNANASTLNRLKEIYNKPRSAKTKDDISFVLSKFSEIGSIDFAQKEAERLSADALSKFDNLTKHIPNSAIKEIARDGISHTAKRSK